MKIFIIDSNVNHDALISMVKAHETNSNTIICVGTSTNATKLDKYFKSLDKKDLDKLISNSNVIVYANDDDNITKLNEFIKKAPTCSTFISDGYYNDNNNKRTNKRNKRTYHSTHTFAKYMYK